MVTIIMEEVVEVEEETVQGFKAGEGEDKVKGLR